ncbi:MAG: hypothetical protein ACRDPM_00795, partial [Solirubrobacteraceae bacterium]
LQHRVPREALRDARRWLYVGDDPTYELAGVQRVASADVTMALARELRGPYLDAIGALSALNDSPEWWASHLAAKQPYPSLFARVCGLAAGRELAQDGTLIVCSTPVQLTELRSELPGARAVGAAGATLRRRGPAEAMRLAWPALRLLGERAPNAARRALTARDTPARFALERTPGHRRRVLEALGAAPLRDFSGDDTVLLVTWLDHRNFTETGAYVDPHLGPLGAMLAERGRRVARLVKVLLHAGFAATARALLTSGERAAFPDSYLSGADWRACEQRVAAFRPTIPDSARVGGVPFAHLAREYARDHVRAQVDALSHELLIRRMAEAGVRPERIVFPWEGHAWEQVLTHAAHKHMPGCLVVGYDNLNFSSLALSLYPAPVEVGIRPLPDRVVTNGPTFAEELSASPFPGNRIRTGCALRHPHLQDAPEPRTGHREGFVLAAGSIDAGQSIELLRKASAAFGDELVASLHPASDARRIRAALPADLRYSDEPLSELLGRARLMLYTYSVVPYEALAAGTPPVFVRSESMLDLDQLEPSPDVRWVARTPEDLRRVAGEIAAMPDRGEWERRAREVVSTAFAPVGPDCLEQFLP